MFRIVSDCPDRTFGQDCSTVCHCYKGIACDHVTGECPVPCAQGYTGPICSEQQFGGNIIWRLLIWYITRCHSIVYSHKKLCSLLIAVGVDE